MGEKCRRCGRRQYPSRTFFCFSRWRRPLFAPAAIVRGRVWQIRAAAARHFDSARSAHMSTRAHAARGQEPGLHIHSPGRRPAAWSCRADRQPGFALPTSLLWVPKAWPQGASCSRRRARALAPCVSPARFFQLAGLVGLASFWSRPPTVELRCSLVAPLWCARPRLAARGRPVALRVPATAVRPRAHARICIP